MLHHGSIRKYTAALLDFFNNVEIQYNLSDGQTLNKDVPIKYSSREKLRELDEYTTEQLIGGNYNVLPRGNIALSAMNKAEVRTTNKNLKINKFKTEDEMDFQWNSVPYEFSFDISYLCRGMNEATQIIEQVAPKFNPIVNIDVWDASNLNEPTRVPVKLLDVSMETEEYEELSSNIVTVIFNLTLTGNLYPPIKSQPRVKEFQMYFNELVGKKVGASEMFKWDVDNEGYIIPETGNIFSSGASAVFVPWQGRIIDGETQGGFSEANINDVKSHLVTTERTQIVNNEIILPFIAQGKVVQNLAKVWNDTDSEWFIEYNCELSEDGTKVIFDAMDDLNGKYAVFSYYTTNDEDQGSANGSNIANITHLVTTPLTQIQNNKIPLPSMAIGGIVHNLAMIWDTQTTPYFVEVACYLDENGMNAMFHPRYNLNGKYCILTYSSLIPDLDISEFIMERDGRKYLNRDAKYVGLVTTNKIQIQNNEMILPSTAIGDIIRDIGMIWNDKDIPWFVEVTCTLSEDGTKVVFDSLDDLNGKFCSLTYWSLLKNV